MELIKVRNRNVRIGTRPSELAMAPRACGETYGGDVCRKRKSPHYCVPRVRFVEELYSYFVIDDGPAVGQPYKISTFHRQLIDRVHGVVYWNEEHQQFIRRSRYAWIIAPRKIGKSSVVAAEAVRTVLTEETAEVIITAQTEQEAEQVIGEKIRRLIALSPFLSNLGIKYLKSENSFIHDDMMSRIRIVAPHERKVRGPSPSLIIVDEVAQVPDADRFIDAATKGWGARRGPLIICATTPHDDQLSFERMPTAKMRNCLFDPDIEPFWAPIIFEADPGDDYWSPKTWRKVIPAINDGYQGISIVEEDAMRARGNSLEENKFLRERLCVHMSSIESYIPMSIWDERAGGDTDWVEERLYECDVLFAGADLSVSHDFSALCLFGYNTETEQYYSRSWGWVPEAVASEFNTVTLGKLDEWIRKGHCELMPAGNSAPEYVGQRMLEKLGRFDIKGLGYDQHKAERAIIRWEEAGLEVEWIKQGGWLSPAITDLLGLVQDETFWHGGDPLLRYAVECAEVIRGESSEEVYKFKRPARKESGKRIDPLVALMCAIRMWHAYRIEKPEKKQFGIFWSDGSSFTS